MTSPQGRPDNLLICSDFRLLTEVVADTSLCSVDLGDYVHVVCHVRPILL